MNDPRYLSEEQNTVVWAEVRTELEQLYEEPPEEELPDDVLAVIIEVEWR